MEYFQMLRALTPRILRSRREKGHACLICLSNSVVESDQTLSSTFKPISRNIRTKLTSCGTGGPKNSGPDYYRTLTELA